ncbi:hypothetical protein XELAEV_18028302mg [Xenopus laevis]|uniref:Uncharacterized protein n=1 Tax=Xenopus laevis TaxID=8355 RepID=A0A974HKG9_XENLA|nr:hypothetical protein XELAEV_18028302mg [Xenopus laevis]
MEIRCYRLDHSAYIYYTLGGTIWIHVHSKAGQPKYFHAWTFLNFQLEGSECKLSVQYVSVSFVQNEVFLNPFLKVCTKIIPFHQSRACKLERP